MGVPLIGIIGFGAIGRDLTGRLSQDGHRLVVLLQQGSLSREAVPADAMVVHSARDLIGAAPDLVVEAAGHAALAALVPGLLQAGLTVVAASTGALADEELTTRLLDAATAGRSRLVIPAGALGGLDYLAALRGTADSTVRYTSRKPPTAWAVELAARGINPTHLTTAITLFEGTASEAARRYPRNLNAGLTVALAAAGSTVVVRVVADPAVTLNTHEIVVESALGTASMTFSNRPSPENPKSSALTAASLAAAVRRHFEPIVI